MSNNIIDLFCGCGGLSKGFELAGFQTTLAIDLWKDAIDTFNFNHKNEVAKCIDIKELTQTFLKQFNEKNNIVGVIGGPPCQGFSTVGTRNIDDPRNSLYLEYCRVVETIQPSFFVLENVKGLLTLDNGFFKNDIIKRFSNLGYKVVFKVLNAANFGVPQNRHRVFFVGIKNKEFSFPKEKDYVLTSKDALSDMPVLEGSTFGLESVQQYQNPPQNDYQKMMRNGSDCIKNNQVTIHSKQTIDIISQIKDGGKIKDLPEEYWNIRKYNKAFERMSSQRPSNTVDTGHRNYFHYSENRIPTARENARLQSFPDNFVFLGTKGSQYKQIGNAVPPLLAFEIANEIKKQIN